MTDYTTTADPTDREVTRLTLGGVTFRVRGADRPGARVGRRWTSQIDQIAAGLALIPAHHREDVAHAEIRIVAGDSGSSYSFGRNVTTIRDGRFVADFNSRTFQSLVHESAHAFDDVRARTAEMRSRCRAGVAREDEWTRSLAAPITGWLPGTSPTFPPASPPDDWDHFRQIPYRGSNKVPASGLPTPGESFAEGYMLYLCRPDRLSDAQRRIIRDLAGF